MKTQIDTLKARCCPCFCTRRGTCTVACSPLPIGRSRRERLCTGEDFDSCALLLAHLLRHSQPVAGRHSSDLLYK